MTSWIFGLIAAILVFGTWWIIRAGRAREHQQALLRQRRDRTGRAMLSSFSTFGTGTQNEAVPRQTAFDHGHSTRASVEHASTLPVSFNNSGGWSSSDYSLPSKSDSSNDSAASASTD